MNPYLDHNAPSSNEPRVAPQTPARRPGSEVDRLDFGGDAFVVRKLREIEALDRRRRSAKAQKHVEQAAAALGAFDLACRQIAKVQRCTVADAYQSVQRHLQHQQDRMAMYLQGGPRPKRSARNT